MVERDNKANVYFEKAKVRLLWLILFTVMINIISLGGLNIIGSIFGGGCLLAFIASRLILKNHPIVSIVVAGICSLLFSIILAIAIFSFFKTGELEGVFMVKEVNSQEFLGLLLFIYFDYLCLSTYYYSMKWASEKSILEKSFGTLDEEELGRIQ